MTKNVRNETELVSIYSLE